MSDQPSAKVCAICSAPVAGRPRVKDAAGRYFCRPCFDLVAAERSTDVAEPQREPAPAPVVDDGIFGLEPADAADEPFDPIGGGSPGEAGGPCPECGMYIAPGSVLCTKCGYLARSGGRIVTRTGVEPDPTGEKARRKATDEATRAAYWKPATMFAVGFGGAVLFQVILHGVAGEPGGVVGHITAYTVGFAINIVLGVIVFLLCAFMWLGVDAPIRLVALQFAGIYAVTDLVTVSLGWIPLLGWLAALATYIGLLQSVLDIDLSDAVLLAALTFLVKVGLWFTIQAYLYGVLTG